MTTDKNNYKDVERAFKAINDKRKPFDELYSYYDGSPSLKYSTKRIQRAFDNSLAYFAQNWAAVIINAVLDRLVLKGFDANNDSINNSIDDLYTRLNLNLDAKDIHESLQITGEAYLIVDRVDNKTEVYFNDPRLCQMFYDSDRPKVKAFAAKKWTGDDGVHLNLYYPDRTEKYFSEKGQTAKSFNLIESVPNELGIIPIFHFRNTRRIIKGELDDSTVSMLNAINKLFSDLMVASEFETFKTKIFISQVDPGEIQISPDMKMWLPARETATGEDTKVLELGGNSLDNFLKPINELANALAIQTRTPKNLFTTLGANISGEALLVEESALVKKVISKQETYDPTWKEFAAYLLQLDGVTVDPNDLNTIWEKPESKQPLTEAQTLLTETQAGIPIITAMRRRGADEADITQLEEDIQVDSARKQESLGNALMNFNRG